MYRFHRTETIKYSPWKFHLVCQMKKIPTPREILSKENTRAPRWCSDAKHRSEWSRKFLFLMFEIRDKAKLWRHLSCILKRVTLLNVVMKLMTKQRRKSVENDELPTVYKGHQILFAWKVTFILFRRIPKHDDDYKIWKPLSITIFFFFLI